MQHPPVYLIVMYTNHLDSDIYSLALKMRLITLVCSFVWDSIVCFHKKLSKKNGVHSQTVLYLMPLRQSCCSVL